MWIMISGPYTAGGAGPSRRAANLRAMNEAALAVLRAGHLPVIGVNLALPMIETAGEHSFEEIMMPVALALAERCDACLRIGGPSPGADAEAASFLKRGLPVFSCLDEVPPAQGSRDPETASA